MQTDLSDWNDLRLVLAISRAGTLARAATLLGQDHSTVFRRLTALEKRLAQVLFERRPGGQYHASEAGQVMAAAAERMEDAAAEAARGIAGRDLHLAGKLRVTASESLAYRILPTVFAAVRRAHPGIVAELAIANRLFSLSRREADVALRADRPREGDLWGRKLADVAWTLYAAPAYAAAHGLPSALDRLSGHALIGWEEQAGGINAAAWLADAAPPESVVFRSNSLIQQMLAARQGIGVAALPCYLGDAEPGLLRAAAAPVPALMRELWIVTHADLRRTARVTAFFAAAGAAIDAARPLIEGRQPCSAPA